MTSDDLSVAVMSHPRRIAAARRVVDNLPELDPALVIDPCPTGNNLENAKAAWSLVGGNATHHLVLQDDVLPCKNFNHWAHEAITDKPNAALAFFVEWGSRTAAALRVAAIRGSRWVELVEGYLPTQALVLPARWAKELASVEDEDIPDDLAAYRSTAGLERLVHVPNPIEHDDLPSQTGNHPMGARHAACYASEPGPFIGDGVTRRLTIVPVFSWLRGTANVHVRRSPLAEEWYKVRAENLLKLHGLSAAALKQSSKAGEAVLPPKARQLLEPWLQELWTTAVALGVAAASGRSPTDASTPSARGALSTLVPGGLRTQLPLRALDEIRHSACEWITAGVQEGIGWRRSGAVDAFGDVPLPDKFFTERRYP